MFHGITSVIFDHRYFFRLANTFFQMTALVVGPTGAVQGRLPHGWCIAAQFNRETGIVEITSPDTDRFSLDIDTSKLDVYSLTHEPVPGTLEDACIEAMYDAERLHRGTRVLARGARARNHEVQEADVLQFQERGMRG